MKRILSALIALCALVHGAARVMCWFGWHRWDSAHITTLTGLRLIRVCQRCERIQMLCHRYPNGKRWWLTVKVGGSHNA